MGDGLVDEQWWRARQDAYLRAATAVWVPASPLNVLEHLERRRRDPAHRIALTDLDDQTLARWLVRIDRWKDCADFDVLRLLHLWYGEREVLPTRVTEALAERLIGFKYWFTDPTPPGVVDQRWYWSENHRLIFHTIEYLAGQAFPDERFPAAGLTGAAHRARAEGRLGAWFDEKARYGFSEWHSDVYYEKDLAPLLTLVEWADDAALAERAAGFLDLLLFDLALHCQRGNVGATHGRSYMKDKSSAPDQPVFAPLKLCFDDTSCDWRIEGADRDPLLPLNEGATLLARARRYRLPEVVRRVATCDTPTLDREHMGLPLDPSEPLAAAPAHPHGWSYTDPERLAFWWDRSALTVWQVVPLTLDAMDRHGLWEADLFAPLRPLRDASAGDREAARRLARDLAPIVNAGLLAEVDTITWRGAHAMLSAAQSYRPGCAGFQHHAWQATLDEDAVVFTTHPANEPWPDASGFADGDHYWTGSATLPRVVQHGRAALVLYAPAYPSPRLELLAAFRYLPFTHAFFPSERFDEVVRDGRWTFGRRGEGYVGLWSWRPVRWREHDPLRVFTNGLREPFDLVAEGGAANVWVVEVGEAPAWAGFAAFRAALADAAIEVVEIDRGAPRPDGAHPGFQATYASPSEGRLRLSWGGPLTVDGRPVPIDASPRFDNPFTRVERGETAMVVRDGAWSLALDLAAGTRRASGP